jgi:hypothetical protein
MNPGASSHCKHKVKEIEALVQEGESSDKYVPFIALTETWLQPHIADAQIHIRGYNINRSDRCSRSGGGVLLYSHESIPSVDVRRFDDGICQCVFTRFPTKKLGIVVIYRPPFCENSSFRRVIGFVEDCVKEGLDDYQMCITGDLNFPFIKWESEQLAGGACLEAQQSARSFLELLSNLFLTQLIKEPFLL